MNQNVGTDDNPTFAGITIPGATVLNGVLYTWPGTDGAGVLRSNGAGSLGWDNNISGFTNDSAYITAGEVAGNETDPEYNANTFATGMDQGVGTGAGPTFASLLLSGLPNCDTIDTDGSGNLVCGTDAGGLSYFSISDGGTTEQIDDTDTINFADGTDIDVVVSATDTVTFNFTNASAFITAGDVSANETDPLYNANTYATGMDQGVDSAATPTFAGLIISGAGTTTFNGVAYTWPGADGAGVLRSDGAGSLTWENNISWFTNDSAYITGGEVAANETDPL